MRTYRALYAFQAVEADEIDLLQGDLVDVSEAAAQNSGSFLVSYGCTVARSCGTRCRCLGPISFAADTT